MPRARAPIVRVHCAAPDNAETALCPQSKLSTSGNCTMMDFTYSALLYITYIVNSLTPVLKNNTKRPHGVHERTGPVNLCGVGGTRHCAQGAAALATRACPAPLTPHPAAHGGAEPLMSK
ncbi:unnamed protein product, partial [Iphiclides podalirius]